MTTVHNKTTTFSSGYLIGGLVLICCLVVGLLYVFIFSSPNHEQAIRELLEERATALNQKNLARYLACFSLQYQSGGQQYEDLKADASQWFSQFATIQFSFQILNIQVDGKNAFVENHYKFSVTNTEGDSLDLNKKELLELHREAEGWKIVSARSPQ
jgi:ketosteroid isomerase-like protein